MIASILTGAGAKLIFNLVNGWFYNRERKNERKYLQDYKILQAHIQLAKANQRNLIFNATHSICAIAIFFSWCFIGIYAMLHPTETDILIPLHHGFLSRLFNQPDAVVTPGRTPGVLFSSWFEITISFATMYALPSRRS